MTTTHEGIWRVPGEESDDLYPGLVVHDDRVTGSITVGPTRLPVWAFIWAATEHGWEQEAEGAYSVSEYGWDARKMGEFLYCLMEMRGEFGRLLLVLADAERCERNSTGDRPWWRTKRHRKRVAEQLRRCLETLADQQGGPPE